MFSALFAAVVLFEYAVIRRNSRMRSRASAHLEEIKLFVRKLMVWPRISDVDTKGRIGPIQIRVHIEWFKRGEFNEFSIDRQTFLAERCPTRC